ncbi:DUF262 domain-containing protein [Hydrogenimonas thermophila]|uniref:DUF262 domain-containing protein n=1 Tax=Hydrogenimonas thermophila TaxID=223786 RepID=UPI0015A717B6|nr:DUF262 domain-containing protein [Hydrogenimonas thermophila]WOE71074.1 DUF262 domain-containing protein [Hydrogenimonas thermophila]WOE73592.1 DUF262 domain-containing protein [Hydrogenimonas thermophila]
MFEKNIDIPDYQRPYSWDNEQVENLIDDLIEAFNNKKDKYLIGNMIFHKTTKNSQQKLNIVDGQQRTITLALLLHILNQCNGKEETKEKQANNSYCTFLANSQISQLSTKSIQNNHKIIQNKLKNFPEEKQKDIAKFILEKTIVTYIITQDLDEAFILFDSQNTRGKPLARKDLLKVHHVRFIKQHNKKKLVAKRWEDITKNSDDKPKDNVDFVLENLMLIRKAIRQELIGDDLVYLDVFKEFIAENDEQELNNYNQPPIFKKFDFDIEKNELSLISKSCNLKGLFIIDDGIEFLPFEVIQSIEGGERFFWFVLKYFYLIEKLKNQDIFTILDDVSGSGNIFLKKIYQSAIILFVDKFGFDNLVPFAIRMFILLLSRRVSNYSIRKNGIVKFEWSEEEKLDVFKLIFLKFSSQTVIKEIDKYIDYHIGEININEISGTKKEFYEPFKKFESELKKILGEKYVKSEE